MLWATFLPVFLLCQAREIEELPGLTFNVGFKHYTGFLQVSKTHFLHYWFVESQNDSTKDPLIFWFNGGPGCSSLVGLLLEMGPYLVNADGRSLRPNLYSWNKLASIVYIESPVGVGYSYATDGNVTTNDDQTSLENYEAMKQFLLTYPQFRHQEIFVIGESYAGIYVPTLAARIVDGQNEFNFNLKGIAIGNGYVSTKLNLVTMAKFAYGHGIIDETVWSEMGKLCCNGDAGRCDSSQLSDLCSMLLPSMVLIQSGGLDIYDIYRECEMNSTYTMGLLALLKDFLTENSSITETLKTGNASKGGAFKKTVLTSFRKNIPLFLGDVACGNYTDILTYMNDEGLRKALNISSNLPKWDFCSGEVMKNYRKQYHDVAPFIKKIIRADVRVLLYYGDTDMACNFMMGQQFSHQLGLRQIRHSRPWKFDAQVGGYKTEYEGLTFITVRGAGHMAPQSRAPQTSYAIKQFLLNRPI